jgi:hypothetical protein
MLKRVAEAASANMPGEESDLMKITPLGAGQEVGRSCHIIDFKVSESTNFYYIFLPRSYRLSVTLYRYPNLET